MGVEPTGGRKTFSSPTLYADCWIDENTSPAMAAINTESSGYFESLVIAACQWVDNYCRRHFIRQQGDQIFVNHELPLREYVVFQLYEKPLVSVDNAWVNVGSTFVPIDLTYMQIDTTSATVKLPPDVTNLLSSSIPLPGVGRDVNIWIRYTAGYSTVPADVVQATARYVKYLYDLDNVVSGIGGFKTQTYSQSALSSNQVDQRLLSVQEALNKYKTSVVLGTGR